MIFITLSVLSGSIIAPTAAQAAGGKQDRQGGSRQPLQTTACREVPAHPSDVILGRPTGNSVTLSVLCYEDADGFVSCGSGVGKPALKTPVRAFNKRLLEDYYAWQWGDAQFIVLDPFWFTQRQRGKNDNWSRTLGDVQYQWLKHTLEAGKCKFRFVFIHHLVGGADEQCRGGAEAAPFFEWGGKNADGSDGFKQNRPGWSAPIHDLLVKNKVNIVFHGHDHFYAKQELDGIIYQEVPQPGAPGNGRTPRSAAEYGYQNGVILGGSGHLRVNVTPAATVVEYLRTDPADNKTGDRKPETPAHRYTVGTP